MNPFEALSQNTELIEQLLGYTFNNKQLLVLSFVHRSFVNEHRDVIEQHNERLEFLGDSVLGLIVSDYLYQNLPEHSEGELSHLRSQIVEAGSCVSYILKLGIAKYVLLGRGEQMSEGRGRESILADLFEALVGAIYLDGGLEKARGFFIGNFSNEVQSAMKEPVRNWKAELQDYSQKKHQKPPAYKVLKETGPDHSKVFEVAVYIEDMLVGEGWGKNKKQAEQMAAQEALKKLK